MQNDFNMWEIDILASLKTLANPWTLFSGTFIHMKRSGSEKKPQKNINDKQKYCKSILFDF